MTIEAYVHARRLWILTEEGVSFPRSGSYGHCYCVGPMQASRGWYSTLAAAVDAAWTRREDAS